MICVKEHTQNYLKIKKILSSTNLLFTSSPLFTSTLSPKVSESPIENPNGDPKIPNESSVIIETVVVKRSQFGFRLVDSEHFGLKVEVKRGEEVKSKFGVSTRQ